MRLPRFLPAVLLTGFVPATLPAAEIAFGQVEKLLAKYCYECHGNNDETRQADLNLQFYATEEAWLAAPDVLDQTLYVVEEKEMPPKRHPAQPTTEERETLLGWLQQSVHRLATAQKNDPGLVVAPRLNHIEYDLVIKELTGQSLEAARFFPRDSGGAEGFNNVGEDLTVDVGLVENWLDAARAVTAHARILPGRGLTWVDRPQPPLSERQAAVFAIRSEWLAWHEREAERQGVNHQKAFTREVEVNGKKKKISSWLAAYLEAAWTFEHRARLGRPRLTIDELALEQKLMPSVLDRIYKLVRQSPSALERRSIPEYAALARRWQELPKPGTAAAAKVGELCAAIDFDVQEGKKGDPLRQLEKPLRSTSSSGFGGRIWTAFAPFPGLNMDLLASRQEQQSSGEAVATDLDLHPFYLMAEDIRQNASPESREKLRQLAALVPAITRPNLAADRQLAASILADFAARAWREPATPEKIQPLLGIYDRGRQGGLSLDTAVKQGLTAVLVSPRFLYRFQESKGETAPRPLAPRELATRLSFALWGTIPDQALLEAADRGELAQEAGLRAQVERMVADPRARALGRQFGGQWLHFAEFAERAQPDAERFKDFSPEIAADMEEEATRFFNDLFQADRPISWLINADSAELSLRLARYYGLVEPEKMAAFDRRLSEWKRYDLPGNRRGVVSMGAILVGRSQPLRTSPIKRGAWVIIDLLGTPMPEPPAGVPTISDDEVSDAGLTVAQQMERHRADPSCMSCHVKLDPMGLALENFGPDGRWRERDTQGNALITEATAPDGRPIKGLPGLVAYLQDGPQLDMIAEQFSHKLLGYLLGRKVQLGDRDLVRSMVTAMKQNGGRVMPALQIAVASPQFRTRRDEPAENPTAATAVNAPAQIVSNLQSPRP